MRLREIPAKRLRLKIKDKVKDKGGQLLQTYFFSGEDTIQQASDGSGGH